MVTGLVSEVCQTRREARQYTQGTSLHLNQFTGHLLQSAERIKHFSHPVHLVPKQVSKTDQDESCPKIPVYLH